MQPTTAAATKGRMVKRVADDLGAARLRAEAEALAAGQMPGVVELVGLEGDPDRPVLVTARVDGFDLDRAGDLSVEEVAGVVAAVATTLADLHDLGLVHGAVMGAHVLVGADGSPVLCGFGYGGRCGEPPVTEPPLPAGHGDPARRPGDPLAPSNDVYALGALLRTLLTTRSEGSPVARRRPVRRGPGEGRGRGLSAAVAGLRRTSQAPVGREGLLVVADRATAHEPALRLGARSMAAAVGLAAPGARLPRRVDLDEGESGAASPAATSLRELRPDTRSPPPPMPEPGRRSPLLVAGVLVAGGLAAVVAGAGALGPGRARTPRRIPSASSAPGAVPTPVPPAVSATTAVGDAGSVGSVPRPNGPVPFPRPDCPPVSAPLAADTDADGCPEALRWAGGVLDAGGRRWTVGQAGDQVATADWSCSGRATLALLHPATGEVFVFAGWAETGHDLVAELAGRVEGGFAIRAADSGDGCPRVAVDRGDATPVTLASSPLRPRP